MSYFDQDDPDARIHRRGGRFIADPGFEEHPRSRSPGSVPATTASGSAALPTEASGRRQPAARPPSLPVGDEAPDSERAIVGRPYNAPARRPPAGRGPAPPESRICSATCGSDGLATALSLPGRRRREQATLDAGRVSRAGARRLDGRTAGDESARSPRMMEGAVGWPTATTTRLSLRHLGGSGRTMSH